MGKNSDARVAKSITNQIQPRGWRRLVPQPFRLIWRQIPLLTNYPKTEFEEISPDYDAYWREKRGNGLGQLSPFQQARAEAVAGLIAQKSTVLDIGCGDGAVLRYIKENVGVEAWGVDRSEIALKAAASHGVRTIQGDLSDSRVIETLPKVDYILALEVLEHMPDPELLLQALSGKARKGIIVSFPNTGYWLHRFRLLFGRAPAQWRRHPGEHLRFWTVKDTRWWVKALGWELQDLQCYEGVNGLNQLIPSWFAMGIIIMIRPNAQ